MQIKDTFTLRLDVPPKSEWLEGLQQRKDIRLKIPPVSYNTGLLEGISNSL
jgi:hypothetical protein